MRSRLITFRASDEEYARMDRVAAFYGLDHSAALRMLVTLHDPARTTALTLPTTEPEVPMDVTSQCRK